MTLSLHPIVYAIASLPPTLFEVDVEFVVEVAVLIAVKVVVEVEVVVVVVDVLFLLNHIQKTHGYGKE